MNSDAFFAMKSSFEFPASATPNEVDRVMKDWWRMTSLQERLKSPQACGKRRETFKSWNAAIFKYIQLFFFFFAVLWKRR